MEALPSPAHPHSPCEALTLSPPSLLPARTLLFPPSCPENLSPPGTERMLGGNSFTFPSGVGPGTFPLRAVRAGRLAKLGWRWGQRKEKERRERSRKSFLEENAGLVCRPDVRRRFNKPPRGLRKALRSSDGPAQSWPSSLERHLHPLG